jgi:hypothetical protein
LKFELGTIQSVLSCFSNILRAGLLHPAHALSAVQVTDEMTEFIQLCWTTAVAQVQSVDHRRLIFALVCHVHATVLLQMISCQNHKDLWRCGDSQYFNGYSPEKPTYIDGLPTYLRDFFPGQPFKTNRCVYVHNNTVPPYNLLYMLALLVHS